MLLAMLLTILAALCIIPSARTLLWFYRNSGATPIIPLLLLLIGVVFGFVAALLWISR